MKIVKNALFIGSLSARGLVEKYGSPLYVYEEETIRNRFRELKESISYPKKRVLFACKANTNPHILRILREEGAFSDVLSPGEILAAEKAGFQPEEMLFTATSVSDTEMKNAVEKGILVNCDSLSQLERYGKMNPDSPVAVRINSDIGAGHHSHVITGGPESKFGIFFSQAAEIKKTAQKFGLHIIGLHHHIGSGILEPKTFLLATNALLLTAKQFEQLEFIDFGGGLGIPYQPSQKRLDLQALGARLSETFSAFCKKYGRELSLYLEPGRYLVAEAGFLLCTVNTVKQSPHYRFVGVDTGFNHLVRPAMYGSYHEILAVDSVESPVRKKTVIAGNLCESGDVFTRDEKGIVERELPELKEGDIVAILNAGAYGFSMASNYNSRPRPAEVLVRNNNSRVIRQRETLDSLFQTNGL